MNFKKPHEQKLLPRLAKTTDPQGIRILGRGLRSSRQDKKCPLQAVFIRGPRGYLDCAGIVPPKEAESIVRDCNVKRPAPGYRAFIRPLRFAIA